MSSPLVDIHKQLGASIGEFAGIKTAFDFGNPIEEHLATRTSVTVFDISHMARIIVQGSNVREFLDMLIPKDITKATTGFMFGPTALLNDRAGFIDDIMLYPLRENQWLIVGNAINRSRILSWLRSKAEELGFKDIEISDITNCTAMIAVQGPRALHSMKLLHLDQLESLKRMQFLQNVSYGSYNIEIVSRSGWTGEDGFELIGSIDSISKVFIDLITKANVKPAGLIARDSLRIEMGFCLYGSEIDDSITPIEARYWVFDLEKRRNYIGKDALIARIREGVEKIRFGIRMKKGTKFIPRKGYPVYVAGLDIQIGVVTSGAYSPVLNRPIAQAYISSKYALPGLEVEVEIRGKKYRGKLVDFPFIRK